MRVAKTRPQAIFTRYVTTTRMQAMTKDSSSSAVGSSVRTIGFDASVEASRALASTQYSESAEERGGSEVNVMGGRIVGDVNTIDGFANWAEQVRHFPAPVKYELAPFSLLAEPIMQVLGVNDAPIPS